MTDQTTHTDGAAGLEDLLEAAAERKLAGEYGDLPARVVTYDDTLQKADVQPLVMLPRDGRLHLADLVRGIPVRWPSAAAGALTFPLVAGDVGWIRVAGAHIAAWKIRGLEADPSAHPRRGRLTDAVFEPGSRPRTNPLPSTSFDPTAAVLYAAVLLLLGDSTASDWVALSSKVESELEQIKNDLNALNSHVHAVGGLLDSLGNPCSGSVAPGPATSYSAVTPVRASKVKAI